MKSNLKTSAEWNDLFRDYFTIEKEEAARLRDEITRLKSSS